jgi:hypothetical protein
VIARCLACGWAGVPTYVGGTLVRAPRRVRTLSGRVEQVPGRREGSAPSLECPRPGCWGALAIGATMHVNTDGSAVRA